MRKQSSAQCKEGQPTVQRSDDELTVLTREIEVRENSHRSDTDEEMEKLQSQFKANQYWRHQLPPLATSSLRSGATSSLITGGTAIMTSMRRDSPSPMTLPNPHIPIPPLAFTRAARTDGPPAPRRGGDDDAVDIATISPLRRPIALSRPGGAPAPTTSDRSPTAPIFRPVVTS